MNTPNGVDNQENATLTEERPTPRQASIPDFLRQIPHEQPWQYLNIIRFGKAVGDFSKAIGVAYRTTVDPMLGEVQTFPEPMLVKMYHHLAPSLGWPEMPRPLRIRAMLSEGRKAGRARPTGQAQAEEGTKPA